MASPIVFKIVNYADTTAYDFIGDDCKLIAGSYQPEINNQGEHIIDTFRTITVGTDQAAVMSEIATIERALFMATRFHKYRTSADSYWLKVSPDTSSAKRTLIYNWSRKDLASRTTSPLMDNNYELISQWTIERHQYWEGLSSRTTNLIGFNNAGLVHITEASGQNNYGTAPARIIDLNCDWSGWTSASPTKLFIGYHPYGIDDTHWLSNVHLGRINHWEAIDPTTTRLNADSDASTGYNVTVDMDYDATAHEWIDRCATKIPHDDDFAPNTLDETQYAGQYIVLLRAKKTVGTDVMRIALGHTTQLDWAQNNDPIDYAQDVYIPSSDTAYHFYNMGVFEFPIGGFRATQRETGSLNSLMANRLVLFAERISGTGDLHLDNYVFIPYEHSLIVSNMLINDSKLHVITNENDEIIPYIVWPSTAYYSVRTPEISANDLTIPPYSRGTWVACVDTAAGTSQLDKTFNVYVKYIPRYYSYKDA